MKLQEVEDAGVKRWAHSTMRFSGGHLQGPRRLCTQLPGPPLLAPGCAPHTWTLVEAQVWLQTSPSTWLQGTETGKGREPGRRGVGWGWEGRKGRESREEIRDN